MGVSVVELHLHVLFTASSLRSPSMYRDLRGARRPPRAPIHVLESY